MNFDLSSQQQALLDSLTEFGSGQLVRVTARGEAPLSRADYAQSGAVGLLGLCLPRTVGGGGHGLLDTALGLEAFTRASTDLALSFSIGAHLFAAAMPIVEHGSPELQSLALPRLASGEWVGANAITEEDAGSDAFALQTTARREGDDWILDGVKSFVTNGPVADIFIVFARSNLRPGAFGVTAFAMPATTRGLSTGPLLGKMGLRGTSASTLSMQGCRLNDAFRLGAEGMGGLVFERSMQWERAGLFAAWTGDMARRLDETIRHVKHRRQGGRRLAERQAVSHRVADMKLRLESARLLWQRACWQIDQGRASPLDISLAKLAVSEAALTSAVDAVRSFGGRGFLVEFGVERSVRDALGAVLASGTSDVQREIIARELGL